MREVLFYTRKRCHLCEEALLVVEQVAATVPCSLAIVDVDSDPALLERYGDKVPVVLIDGRMHAKYRVDAEAMRRRLRTAGENASP